MLFLIEYDRARGALVRITSFESNARAAAEDARLKLELQLNDSGIVSEVVLLEADSEEALRRTHRRYFKRLNEFVMQSG